MKQIGDVKLFDVLELSKLLGVTGQSIRKYIQSGKLRASVIGRKHYITLDSFKEMLGEGDAQKLKKKGKG